MTDEQFEELLKQRLQSRSVNLSRGKKYDRVYELLMRYCRAKNIGMTSLIWDTMDKYLKSQMK